MPQLRYLKGLLWFIAVYQLVMGLLLLVSPTFAQLVVAWYGASVEWTPQFTFILKPLGAYMVMTGIIAWGAARAEIPHPMITYALAVLFTINAVYRVLRFESIQTTFGISAAHLILQVVVLLALAAACFFLQRAGDRRATPISA